MSFEHFMELLLPPILFPRKREHAVDRIEPAFISTIGSIEKNDDTLFVIGNGPSLYHSMEDDWNEIADHDCVAVNNFCEAEYYSKLKPTLYLLADPAYFGHIETCCDRLKKKINSFIDTIIEHTRWDMNLVLPSVAIGCELVDRIQQNNSFVHFYYYNVQNTIDEQSSTNKYELWDKNLIAPPAQTCLNTALWLGVFLRYQNIYLIGADTSWIELLRIDQESNALYTIDSHFYGREKIQLYSDKEGKVPRELHDELRNISEALRLYWELKEYAAFAGVNVYNASEYSLIDAFERKKLKVIQHEKNKIYLP